MASLASLGEDYLHILCKRNNIKERNKKKYEVLSLQLSLLEIVSAHHLLLCLFNILNLFISFQWQYTISNGQIIKEKCMIDLLIE